MRVPFVDIAAQHQMLANELQDVFARVLRDSTFVLGPEVLDFEAAFAAYMNAPHCVAVNSGTAALQLTLQALGIGYGDEVITVPNTFIATAEAITAVGARPVFVDVDPISYNMDPVAAENAITPRTRAMLPVHLYGQAADLGALLAIAHRHNIFLVEDACQAHGALYNERKAGTLGIAGCFSFYPGKNLGCLGEGGAVVTNDPEIAAQVRILRDHGSLRKYEHRIPGYNFRMEGLQGGFLAAKLKRLDSWNEQRRRLAARYDRLLEGTPLILPQEMPHSRHVYHLYVVQVEDRDHVRDQMSVAGVETGIHYPKPVHLQEAYAALGYAPGSFPVTETLSRRVLSLPMFPTLTEEMIEYVAFVLREALQCPAVNQQQMAA
jgi:dTDP-4-amino-4,6-dideoxygalactose transaminase